MLREENKEVVLMREDKTLSRLAEVDVMGTPNLRRTLVTRLAYLKPNCSKGSSTFAKYIDFAVCYENCEITVRLASVCAWKRYGS